MNLLKFTFNDNLKKKLEFCDGGTTPENVLLIFKYTEQFTSIG